VILHFTHTAAEPLERILERGVRAMAKHLLKQRHGICGGGGVGRRHESEGVKQAANESWGQLGHPNPDARPLGRDVISPGHEHKSCTGHEPLSRGICASESAKSAGFQTLGRVAHTVRIRARRDAPAAQQETQWT
jgi:hypothetical protein